MMSADNSTERPLVTFALFAYNQEKYIREAVEGAFAQTYEPLEIILSDDFSTDRTYEIIKEMVKEYQGSHQVRVRQSQKNRGLMEHLCDVAEIASSDVIILAAGDDISHPDRTEVISRTFAADKDVMAVYSRYIETGECRKVSSGVLPTVEKVPMIDIIINGGGVGKGATYSYKKKCFNWPSRLQSCFYSEDRILPLRAALLGKVLYVDSALIQYRSLATSLGKSLKLTGLLGFNHPRHWQHVRETLQIAMRQGVINIPTWFLLTTAANIRSNSIMLMQKQTGLAATTLRVFGEILFGTLRVCRKIQRREKYDLSL